MYLGRRCPFFAPEVPPLHVVPNPGPQRGCGLLLPSSWSISRRGDIRRGWTEGLHTETARKGVSVVPTRASSAPNAETCSESVSETRSHRQGQKESSPNGGEPQQSRRGRPCGPRRRGSSQGQRKVSTPVDTQREPWSQKNKGRQACGLFCRRTGGH